MELPVFLKNWERFAANRIVVRAQRANEQGKESKDKRETNKKNNPSTQSKENDLISTQRNREGTRVNKLP